jgi:ATP-dependent Clp protease protease subunit
VSSTALPASVEQQAIPYEMISLQSLGTHMLFGEIDETSALSTCEFIIKANLLSQDNSPLTLFVNSEGGSTTDGFAIIDVMETSRLPVQTVGCGLIASMGLLITCAGQKGTRTLTKSAEVMAHQFSGYIAGKQHELVATTRAFERLEQQFIRHFLRHSNMTEKQIRDVLFSPSDRYLTPMECRKYGLCDRVTEYLDIPVPRLPKRAAKTAPVVKKARVARKSID